MAAGTLQVVDAIAHLMRNHFHGAVVGLRLSAAEERRACKQGEGEQGLAAGERRMHERLLVLVGGSVAAPGGERGGFRVEYMPDARGDVTPVMAG